jgi:hypothetical protein
VVFYGYSGSSTNKTDRHDITEILLKVALNTTSLPYVYLFDFLLFFGGRVDGGEKNDGILVLF